MRVLLNGKGVPNPVEALPAPSVSSELPPVVLNLTSGFDKTPWVEQGYTDFEVWCVGGAGGPGGDTFDGTLLQPGPGPGPFIAAVIWPTYYLVGADGVGHGHYYNAFLDSPTEAGGGGGGGGIQRASGLLATLPDLAPVVVGAAGAKGRSGVSGQEALVRPYSNNAGVPYPDDPIGPIYDPPFFMVGSALPGQDGGASSFNGITCRASGGKGGGPGRKWINHVESVDGSGGQGGIGGQATPGGGADGSTSYNVNGKDGTWTGSVGQGGGGGHGGKRVLVHDPQQGQGEGWSWQISKQGSAGGQGAFSFGDTTMAGPREMPHDLIVTGENPKVVPPQHYVITYSVFSPGGGGGAKPQGLLYGSHAPGFNPNGLVLIRLTKLT